MSKHDDAELILKLYDLRREPVMREARNWIFTSIPLAFRTLSRCLGEHSGHYRMVISYGTCGGPVIRAIERRCSTRPTVNTSCLSKIGGLEDVRTLFGNPTSAQS